MKANPGKATFVDRNAAAKLTGILMQQAPEGLAAFHKGEIDKWWPVIKAAGIKVE